MTENDWELDWPYSLALDQTRPGSVGPLRWRYDEDVTAVTFQYGPDLSATLTTPYATAGEIVSWARDDHSPLAAWLRQVEHRAEGR